MRTWECPRVLLFISRALTNSCFPFFPRHSALQGGLLFCYGWFHTQFDSAKLRLASIFSEFYDRASACSKSKSLQACGLYHQFCVSFGCSWANVLEMLQRWIINNCCQHWLSHTVALCFAPCLIMLHVYRMKKQRKIQFAIDPRRLAVCAYFQTELQMQALMSWWECSKIGLACTT